MDNKNIFKASSVELATKIGLEQLNLQEDEADIEIIASGGIFARAQVKITPKEVESVENSPKNEVIEEDIEKTATTETEKKPRTNTKKENFSQRERVDSEEKKQGKLFLEQLVSFMPVQARIDAKQFKDEVCFYIGGDDANFFIGHRGETLDAIQYLVSQFVNKNTTNRIRVSVDADFYRERRKRTLTSLALKLAKNAYNGKKEIALEPMNSYERRIIHFALQDNELCTTRSEGEGRERHVIIVPKCEVISYGVASEFRRKGPARTKSYGYNKRKF